MLDERTILWLHDVGRTRHPVDRALLLLAAHQPDADADALADRHLGDRNRAMLRVLADELGPAPPGEVLCPGCGELLAFPIDIDRLLALDSAWNAAGIEAAHWEEPPWEVRFRLPTSRDLGDAARAEAAPGAAAVLRAACILEARHGGAPVDAADIPEDVVDAVGRAMADAEPCLEFLVSCRCPECARTWTASFDPGGYCWNVVAGRARAVLEQVDSLARAYGWSETEILALTPHRRSDYLALTTR